MGIPVKLQVFEGPLDLLLHLIDKNKVNIYDIPIVVITEQYMEYVSGMEKKNLDVVSEFLVMAATLLEIKSKMLLPAREKEVEEEDPRQELVQKLLEYKLYKYMSHELRDRQVDAERAVYKKATIPREVEAYKPSINLEELLKGVTLTKLNAIFQSVMKKKEDKIDPVRSKFGKIEKEEINLEDRLKYVQQFLLKYEKLSFSRMLEENRSKMAVVVTFLVVLELIKTGFIHVVQENPMGEIYITVQKDPSMIKGLAQSESVESKAAYSD